MKIRQRPLIQLKREILKQLKGNSGGVARLDITELELESLRPYLDQCFPSTQVADPSQNEESEYEYLHDEYVITLGKKQYPALLTLTPEWFQNINTKPKELDKSVFIHRIAIFISEESKPQPVKVTTKETKNDALSFFNQAKVKYPSMIVRLNGITVDLWEPIKWLEHMYPSLALAEIVTMVEHFDNIRGKECFRRYSQGVTGGSTVTGKKEVRYHEIQQAYLKVQKAHSHAKHTSICNHLAGKDCKEISIKKEPFAYGLHVRTHGFGLKTIKIATQDLK